MKNPLHEALHIVAFATHPKLLNLSLSIAQRACLKTIYGLPLEPDELEVYQRATARTDYHPHEHRECTIIAGRRAGKTSRLAAPIVCYEAFRKHELAPGEQAYILLIAPVKDQAQIAFRYIRAYLKDSPILAPYVATVGKGEIKLTNGVTIACVTCSYVSVRGFSVVCAVADEFAFWGDRETAANPAEEVLAALRPAMASFPTAKLVKISSPFGKEGLLWREFQQRAELEHPVWHLPSPEMNPALEPQVLEEERRRDEEMYRREYLAEFTDSLRSWVDAEVLNACIVAGRVELPPLPQGHYVGAIDPAFRQSDFALAVLHRNADGMLVVDLLRRWTGSKKTPVSFEGVCHEVREIVRPFRITRIIGDQHCAAVIKQQFQKLHLDYQEFPIGTSTRAQIFGNLRHLIAQRKIELLDDPHLLRQLRALEEETSGGRIDVRPRYGIKDDLAVVLAMGAFELDTEPGPLPPLPPVMGTGGGPRPRPPRLSGSGPIPAQELPDCPRFPGCVMDGSCDCPEGKELAWLLGF